MKTITLENAGLRAEFDPTTGALRRLVNKPTGWAIEDRTDLALSFRMLIPLPDRRNHSLDGAGQAPPEITVSQDGHTLTFLWRGLRSPLAGPLDITLRTTVELADGGLTFRASVENHSAYVVESLSYPCLGDLSLPAPDETLTRMSLGYAGLNTSSLLPTFSGDMGYFGFDCPIRIVNYPETPFILAAAKDQGLYVGCHDTSAREPVRFAFELKPGFETVNGWSNGMASPAGQIDGRPSHLELTLWHFPYAAPGETIEPAPIVLAPYVGSWHAGADIYKVWRRTWFKAPETPAWARDVHAWQQIQINSPEDELRCRYSDLVKFGEDCARHGVAAIQLVGWNNGGQDRGNPSHDTDPRLGTPEELRAAIEKIHKLGVKVILFTKFTWADRSQPWFREELERYAAKDPYGDCYWHQGYNYQTPTQLADLNTRRFSPLCPNCAAWREIANREFHKTIALGAAGMLYDECQHHGRAAYCFDPSHGHRVPTDVFTGDAPLAEGFHEIARRESPDYLFAGEALYDLEYRHYSISYFRIYNLNTVAALRYVEPDAGMMVAVVGFNDRHTINQCLLYRYIISYEPFNFKGRLDDFPRTIDYGKRVDALRRRYREFLWDGEFRDTLGAKVTADGQPHKSYAVFRAAQGGQRAVVVANFTTDRTLALEIALDGPASPLVSATPESPDAVPTDGRLTLPPQSAVVVMES